MSKRIKQGVTEAPDWTKLESYVGLQWDQAQETLRTCGHMLAFGEDAWAVDVTKTAMDYGGEAGMAALVSALFVKKHGANSAATTAAEIYRDIAKKREDWSLSSRVENMAFMVYFADRSGGKKLEWPMPWPFEDDDRRAGQANVMLLMAAKRLVDGTTSESVAALGIQRFLAEGAKKFQSRQRSPEKVGS